MRLPILQTKTLEVQSGQPYEVDPELIRAIGNNGNDSRSLQAHPPGFVTKSTEQTIQGNILLLIKIDCSRQRLRIVILLCYVMLFYVNLTN